MRRSVRLGILAAGSFAALFAVPAAIADKPTLAVQNMVVEATGANGAVVVYTITAKDDNGPPKVTCSPADGSMLPLGRTKVGCTAVDTKTGQSATASFRVTVRDTTAPAVTVPKSVTTEASGAAGAVVTYSGVSATDLVSGKLTPSCDKPPGSPFPLGTSTVECSATDGAGNNGSATFKVIVVDTTPPVVTVPSSIDGVVATGPGGAKVTYSGVSAKDTVSGVLTPTCDKPSGSTFPVGKTTVTCSATDTAGNKGSASFTITVTDAKSPTLAVPGGVTAEATGPSGATVGYRVTATDGGGGSITPTCDPASGSFFRIGTTTVSCKATDSSGKSASASFSVTVRDTRPPVFRDVPADLVSEANGPAGSPVSYQRPTAVDTVDGAVPTSCSPSSGSNYPIGSTQVTCRASDSRGNSGTATFSIDIVDTTPPVLTAPARIVVSSHGGESVPTATAAIAGFLAGASASDIVDGVVKVTNDAPGGFAVGTTTVTFTARDMAGNSVTAKSTVTVTRESVAAAKPLDRAPPDNVRGLSAKSSDRMVTLIWRRPRAGDFDHVVVSRSTRGSPERRVYAGPALRYADRNLKNGVDYRYVVVSYDRAGNRAAGIAIVAAPKLEMLIGPPDAARVTRAPLLRWRSVAGATYYNVQLFRGRKKILTAWPVRTQLRLSASWLYGGHLEHLTPGLYHWYVFPGMGPRSASRYGPALGPSTFSLVTRK